MKIIFILQGEGMTFDINAALKDCEGKDKIEERKDTGKVRNLIIIYNYNFSVKNLIQQHM